MSSALQLATRYAVPAIAALAGLYAVRRALRRSPAPPAGAVVVVTGCDSGIALACAKQLANEIGKDGKPAYRVLAGCLTAKGRADLDALGLPNLVTFDLDVTKDESVKAMVDFVDKECGDKGLFGLYNVAGVLGGSVVDLTPLAEFRRVMEVNFFGVVRCIQGLYPLLHKNAHLARLATLRGNPTLGPAIITVSSGAAELPWPGSSPYPCSKHAVKALLNSLRAETAHLGFRIVEIRPFVVKTNIGPTADEAGYRKIVDSFTGAFGVPAPDGEKSDPFGRENPLNRYRGGAEAQADLIMKAMKGARPETYMTPEFVAAKMHAELVSENPRTAVVVAHRFGEWMVYFWVRFLPDSFGRMMAAGFAKGRAPLLRDLVAEGVGLEGGEVQMVDVGEVKAKELVAA
ncbi:hypothetical protein DFJ74DRAFT_751097 [Hyaloraphidium curvatum]|nr:hypothetical protein DFJ74DRAFT_751097 [Hyaloraphidium curvatum]